MLKLIVKIAGRAEALKKWREAQFKTSLNLPVQKNGGKR